MPNWKSHNDPVTHEDLSALLEHINRLKSDMADNIEAIATLNQRTSLIANQLVDCMTSVNYILDVLKTPEVSTATLPSPKKALSNCCTLCEAKGILVKPLVGAGATTLSTLCEQCWEKYKEQLSNEPT